MFNEQIFNLEIAPGIRKDKTFTKFEAYIFLIVKGTQEQELSGYYLAKTWGWSRTKVKKFIEYLEESSLLTLDEKSNKKDTEKSTEKNSKKDMRKHYKFKARRELKDTIKDNEKDIGKDIVKNIDLGSIQAIINM